MDDITYNNEFEAFKREYESKESQESNPNQPSENQQSNILETITSSELLKREFPSQEYLIQDLIKPYGFTAISGPPYSFKSFLALYFIICIASGKKVFDKFDVPKAGACLIIDKENELVMLQERLKMLGVTEDSALPIHFLVLPEKYTLTDPKIIEWTKEFVVQNEIVLILYDSFIHIHKGNENDSDAVRTTFTYLKNIPCAKMFITHHKKPTRFEVGTVLDRIRGSSDIGAELENHLAMDMFGEGTVRITQGKNRGGKLVQPFTVKPIITPETALFEYVGQITSDMNKANQARSFIVDLLKDGVERRRKDIVEALSDSISESNIDSALKEMEKKKEVKVRMEGKFKMILLNPDYVSPVEESYIEQADLELEYD